MPGYYITTAIDYVNSLPHIGTAYEKVGADVLARFHRFLGEEVRFQMGSDEHSLNVKKEAEKRGLDPKIYCDQMREGFEAVWKKLNISYDEFIQTSDPRHHLSVQKFFALLSDRGDIEERDYEGFYCESCEAFYLEKDLSEGLCPHHGKKPAWIKEKNLFFKLSQYGPRLLEHIRSHPDFIRPKSRENEIVSLIEGGLEDVSISRAGAAWGIPVPMKPGHVVYVWFDALINYVSSLGYHLEVGDSKRTMEKWWPASLHVIGKDITRFHCVIWPAMLMAAGLPLPTTVFGHGFVYLKGEKMSKSLGNIVTPLDVVDRFGPDALRYYLLREGGFGRDGDFTWENFTLRYTSDLANGLGNLLARTLGMLKKYQNGIWIKAESDFSSELRAQAAAIFERVRLALDPASGDDIEFHKALAAIWELIALCDRHVDREAPWTLMKEGQTEKLSAVLYALGEGLRLIATLVAPFLPETAEKIWMQVGLNSVVPFKALSQSALSSLSLPDQLASCGTGPMFPRIEG